jgi:hypothetical protein
MSVTLPTLMFKHWWVEAWRVKLRVSLACRMSSLCVRRIWAEHPNFRCFRYISAPSRSFRSKHMWPTHYFLLPSTFCDFSRSIFCRGNPRAQLLAMFSVSASPQPWRPSPPPVPLRVALCSTNSFSRSARATLAPPRSQGVGQYRKSVTVVRCWLRIL